VRALLSSLEQAGLIADRGPRSQKPAVATAPPNGLAAAPTSALMAQPIRQQAAPEASTGNPSAQRRPSPILWQTLPELTDVSDGPGVVPTVLPTVVSAVVAAVPAPAPVASPATWAAATEATARRPDAARAPPVLTEVHASSDASRLAQMDAMAALADLAELAGQTAGAAHTAQASNILTHNALMAANDEPESGAGSKRAAVRHAVELMSNYVLEHMPRTASQVLPEIESLHSVDQWAELMDGYAMFIAPTGERGHSHMAQLRRMLNAAFDAADVSPKGWYA
jgi:hypothetical protein